SRFPKEHSHSCEEASQDRATVRIRQYVCIVADHINPTDEVTIGNLLDFWIGYPATQRLRETLQRNYLKWPAEEIPHSCWEWFGDFERIVHGSYQLVGLSQPLLALGPSLGKLYPT